MKFIKVLVAIGITALLTSGPLAAQDDLRGREIGSGISPEPNRMFFSSDGSRLVINARNGSANAVHVLDVASGAEIEQIGQRHAAVSGDQKLMATYGPSGQLEIRDVATGAVLHELAFTGAYESARPMFVANDTLLLASWLDSRTILIDVETGEVVAQFQLAEATNLYGPVGLSADGQWVVTGHRGNFLIWARDGNGPVRSFSTGGGWTSGKLDGRGHLITSAEEQDYLDVVPLAPGEPIRRIELGRAGYRSMTVNPEGTLAVLRFGRAGAVVDLEAEVLLYNLEPRVGSEIKGISFSPDGSMIAIGRAYGAVILIDARTGAFRGLHVPHIQTPVAGLAFSPDGAFIVSSSTREMRIWPAATALATAPPIAAQYCVDAQFIGMSAGTALAALPEGQIFLDRSGSLQLMAPETGTIEPFSEDIEFAVTAFGVSSDQRFLFAMLKDNRVDIRSIENGARVSVLGPHSYKLRDVVLAGNGTRAMTMDKEGIAALWDATTGQDLLVINVAEFRVSAIALSQNMAAAVFASSNNLVFFSAVDGAFLAEYALAGHIDGTIAYVRFLPNDRILVASKDGDFAVFDWQTGDNLVTFHVEIKHWLDFVEVSPDGQTFVHDDERFTIQRETETGNEIQRFAHDITVDTAKYGPEGAQLLTAAGDSTVRLWSLETGDELARYVGHHGIIAEIDFLPGGGGVVSAGLDRKVCVYDLPHD
ncbi:MAG: PQQ-binding-like beta-propeller repeat protein [Rhodobacteraceae bacterium]|nr:PQQ-binding-like beta-propeller repeat protein [Paracoccaceae bacterium]